MKNSIAVNFIMMYLKETEYKKICHSQSFGTRTFYSIEEITEEDFIGFRTET